VVDHDRGLLDRPLEVLVGNDLELLDVVFTALVTRALEPVELVGGE
jgi:hypothetical protein